MVEPRAEETEDVVEGVGGDEAWWGLGTWRRLWRRKGKGKKKVFDERVESRLVQRQY